MARPTSLLTVTLLLLAVFHFQVTLPNAINISVYQWEEGGDAEDGGYDGSGDYEDDPAMTGDGSDQLREMVNQLTPEQKESAIAEVNATVNGCTPKKLNLNSLAGRWRLALYKKPTTDTVTLELTLLSESTLSGKLRVNSKTYGLNLLRLDAGNPALLINLLPVARGGLLRFPVLVTALQAGQYFTTFTAGFGTQDTIDWAVYTPKDAPELSDDQVKAATAGLECLNAGQGNGAEGQLVYPAGGGRDSRQGPDDKQQSEDMEYDDEGFEEVEPEEQ